MDVACSVIGLRLTNVQHSNFAFSNLNVVWTVIGFNTRVNLISCQIREKDRTLFVFFVCRFPMIF